MTTALLQWSAEMSSALKSTEKLQVSRQFVEQQRADGIAIGNHEVLAIHDFPSTQLGIMDFPSHPSSLR